MAKLNDSLLAGASGKLNGCVIYKVGKDTYARKLADTVSNPRTDEQTLQRSKLPGAQTMFRAMRGSLLESVNAIAARENERRSGYHWFLHANMNMFGADQYIDYPRLVLTAGSLQLPFALKAAGSDEGYLELEWMDNSSTVTAQSTDRLLVAAIFDDEPYLPVMLDVEEFYRSDRHGIVNLPEGTWRTAHLYCFFGAEDKKRYSPCMYFSVRKS